MSFLRGILPFWQGGEDGLERGSFGSLVRDLFLEPALFLLDLLDGGDVLGFRLTVLLGCHGVVD